MTAQPEKVAPTILNATTKAPVDELRFDRFNPRLLGQTANASDEFIIAHLYRSAELDELLQSVSTNGYLDRVVNTQSKSFRGATASPFVEHDFCFVV